MADESGFQYVSRKKRKKRGKAKSDPHRTSPNNKEDAEYCNVDRITAQIESYRDEIQASVFYTELTELFSKYCNHGQINENNVDISQDASHPVELATCSSVQDIVCYGVGCIRTCPSARYQFALLILLRQFLKVSCRNCCIYEPLFNKNDEYIVQHFGFDVIKENEEAKRRVSQSTLFYMPHCSKLLYNNVLWANWGPALKNLLIFGNGFSSYEIRLPSRQLFSQVMYIAKILPYTTEVGIPNSFYLKDIFNDSALHMFNVGKLENLPSDFWTPCPEPSYDENDPEIVTNKIDI